MRIQVAVSNDVYPPTFGLSSRVWGLAHAMSRTEEVRLTCAVGSSSRAAAREKVQGVELRRVRTGHPTFFYYLQKLGFLSDYVTADVYRAWPGPLGRQLDREADVWQIESLNLTPLLERAPSRAIRVYASQNVEAEWFERVSPKIFGRGRWAKRVEDLERQAVATADIVIAVCEEDRTTFMRRYGVPQDRVWVVDNGFDEGEVRPPTPEERAAARRAFELGDQKMLVFVGSDVPHNRDAVEMLFRHVVPQLERLHAVLFLTGGVSSAFAARAATSGRVRALGFRPDILPVLWAADIALHPMTMGAGSNVKLPMMLAAGLPVLSTSFGLRGFGPLTPYVEILEPGEFADAIAEGVRLPPGAQAAIESYSWRGLGARLVERYRERPEGRTACAS
jgi:glycosyltransferase involved in cell wall biosynthesis